MKSELQSFLKAFAVDSVDTSDLFVEVALFMPGGGECDAKGYARQRVRELRYLGILGVSYLVGKEVTWRFLSTTHIQASRMFYYSGTTLLATDQIDLGPRGFGECEAGTNLSFVTRVDGNYHFVVIEHDPLELFDDLLTAMG